MTKRRAHNSILFLTTLSVYLGIVLVGGSPSVLAQAALTPRFELVTEFESEDDLDNKPDGEIAFADDAAVYSEFVRLAAQFVAESQDNFSLSPYTFEHPAANALNSPFNLRTPGASVNLAGLDRPFLALGKRLSPAAVSVNARFQALPEPGIDSFSLTTAFKQSPNLGGITAVAFYDPPITRRAVENSRPVFLRRTSVYIPNNQVAVVTRLPRASIDDSLAEKQ